MKLAPHTTCTACMACIDSCHQGALSISLDRDGFYCIKVEKSKCVECGLCSKVCPVLNPISFERDKLELSKPYAVWCTDEELRQKSASGGAFAAIAKSFLGKGAVIYGAAIEGFEIHHQRIDNLRDLPRILGSKYQHSRMDGIYKQILNDLRLGNTVLFCGLSCQVAGLLRITPSNLQKKLYTIDTICGGLSTMLPMNQLESTGEYLGINSFRNKDLGWKSKGYKYALRMNRKDGTVCDLGIENMPIRCFCHKETKRSSCYDCQFNGFHRMADLTIGDFWGDTRFCEQHFKGLSIMVSHSEKLVNYINSAPLHLEPVTWAEVVNFNPSYYWNHNPQCRHSFKRKIVFCFLRSGKVLSANKVLSSNGLISRLEAYLFYRDNECERQSYLHRILNGK